MVTIIYQLYALLQAVKYYVPVIGTVCRGHCGINFITNEPQI